VGLLSGLVAAAIAELRHEEPVSGSDGLVTVRTGTFYVSARRLVYEGAHTPGDF
jgi:hypothetical protein